MFLTALLVFVILMLAAEKHNATYIAPVGIGLALFVAELAGMLTFTPTETIADRWRRCVLHRRQSQSNEIIRTGCRSGLLPRLSLHLLDRPFARSWTRKWLLQIHQALELRGGQSWSRRFDREVEHTLVLNFILQGLASRPQGSRP